MATNIVSSAIVLQVLTKHNYANWSVCVKNYLLAHDLWDIIEATTEPPKLEDAEADFKAWRKKNAAALHAIQISCGPDILSHIRQITSAKIAWDTLAIMYEPPSLDVNPGTVINEYLQYVPLQKAVDNGKWCTVEEFLGGNPHAVNARVTFTGKTALHAATIAGHVHIVKKLVELMSEQDMEIKEMHGCTALAFAAVTGITEMAERMVQKNKNLVSIEDLDGMIPVTIASVNHQTDMTRYLYSVTPLEDLTREKDTNGATLLSYCIDGNLFDIALDLLQRCPRLVFAKDKNHLSPVYKLATMPSAFPSGSRLVFWQRWIYNLQRLLQGLVSNLLKVFQIKQIYDMKSTHVQALELLDCMFKQIPSLDDRQLSEGLVYESFTQAVKHGNVEFITEIVKANPDLLWTIDENSRHMFSRAIKYRQEKTFSLFYGLDARKDMMAARVDKNGNNMLHLAGILAPSNQLDRISGAALQMQRELQWFKEVESIVHPKCKEELNADGITPPNLFTANHKDLKKEGESWMKETATSCTVVGALIITVMFAGVFTVPGGNNGDTGVPIFVQDKLFKVFIVSDAISLFSSSTSVLMFLGILTSRYAEEDFLKSLPNKLIIGLYTLFFSIATMMVAFCAAISMMLRSQAWIVIPIILLASIPVTLFVLLQFPLLVEIFISTYGSGIFNRNMKRWY